MQSSPTSSPSRRTKSAADGSQEALYLRYLSEKHTMVQVKLRDGEIVTGWIEYFDDRMIRLTRESHPNLFIYKEQIHTISEANRREQGRQRAAVRKAERATHGENG